MNMSQSLKINALGIGAFSAITAALIALTFVYTKAPIAENIRQQKSAKLFEIIDQQTIDNDVFSDSMLIDGSALGYKQDITIHFGINNGDIKTIIFPVLTSQGYSGDISLLVGINYDQTIAGVRVISHTETPGLGDKLELKKSPWLLEFNGKSKTDGTLWAVKKDGGDFDQFTGATITPRAVVQAVSDSLDFFKDNELQLINEFKSGSNSNDN